MSDPLAFLAQPPEDWAIALAVVQRAHDFQAERRKNEIQALIDGISKGAGYEVARHLARLFR